MRNVQLRAEVGPFFIRTLISQLSVFARVEEGNKVMIQSLFLLVTFISLNTLVAVK